MGQLRATAGWAILSLSLLGMASLTIRARDLERYPLQVDWANYLYSAGVLDISGQESFADAMVSDLRWVASDNFLHKPMPHSYLHQYVMRAAYRVFRSSRSAACLAAVVFGALTPLVLYRQLARDTRAVVPALYAAAVIGLVPFHVLYSRSGWSEIPAALFVLVYFHQCLAFFAVPDGEPRALARRAMGMSLALLAACGFHEVAIVSGLATLAVFGGERVRSLLDRRTERFLDRRLAYVILSVVPSGIYALAIFSSMPRGLAAYTFSPPDRYLADVMQMLDWVFIRQELHHQLSIPLLALCGVGVVHLWRTRRRHCVLLLAQLAGWAAALAIMPHTTMHNLRVFLPAFVLMANAAGYGLLWLYALAERRRPVFHFAAVCLVSYLAVTSSTLIFLSADVAWTGKHIPRQLTYAGRDSALPLRRYIEQTIAASHRAGGFFIMEGPFYLKDAGVEAKWLGYRFTRVRNALPAERDLWPDFVIASPDRWPPGTPEWFQRAFLQTYELAAADRLGRCAVFAKRTN